MAKILCTRLFIYLVLYVQEVVTHLYSNYIKWVTRWCPGSSVYLGIRTISTIHIIPSFYLGLIYQGE